MEGINKICCVLDACTIINLIHIDEEDFVLKTLKSIEFNICEKVYDELRINIKNKEAKTQIKSCQEKADYHKKLDKALTFFRGVQIYNSKIETDFGNDFFEQVQVLTSYKKNNGEFFSTALCLYLSRYKGQKIFFHTDDYKAKDDLRFFFGYQQIGKIEDTVDLLIVLFYLSNNFSEATLIRLLSSLYAEYTTDVTLLREELIRFNSNLPKAFLRDKYIKSKLSNFIFSLTNLKFSGLNSSVEELRRSSKYSDIVTIIDRYSKVLELETTKSTGILEKITRCCKQFEKYPIFRVINN